MHRKKRKLRVSFDLKLNLTRISCVKFDDPSNLMTLPLWCCQCAIRAAVSRISVVRMMYAFLADNTARSFAALNICFGRRLSSAAICALDMRSFFFVIKIFELPFYDDKCDDERDELGRDQRERTVHLQIDAS